MLQWNQLAPLGSISKSGVGSENSAPVSFFADKKSVMTLRTVATVKTIPDQAASCCKRGKSFTFPPVHHVSAIIPHPYPSPQSGEAPGHNRCGWSGPVAYNVLCCTQKRRVQGRLHRVSHTEVSMLYARAGHRHLGAPLTGAPDPGWVKGAD